MNGNQGINGVVVRLLQRTESFDPKFELETSTYNNGTADGYYFQQLVMEGNVLQFNFERDSLHRVSHPDYLPIVVPVYEILSNTTNTLPAIALNHKIWSHPLGRLCWNSIRTWRWSARCSSSWRNRSTGCWLHCGNNNHRWTIRVFNFTTSNLSTQPLKEKPPRPSPLKTIVTPTQHLKNNPYTLNHDYRQLDSSKSTKFTENLEQLSREKFTGTISQIAKENINAPSRE